ncbi:MAG TPA: RpiB/LacA/LacB family sugar-phosphate isomerase, partial [Candidatus Saccharimonadales bacterium]|nr:RpiB/LacA/LacB family sugar-phosphate isomerase [Candidatus Saccharimonadales bacterium]
MKIYLATDHAGFTLKEKVYAFLIEKGYTVEDCGAYEEDSADDFPDFISAAAKKVSGNQEDRAIIFGGSGQGEAMVANKFPGVRAAVFYSPILPKEAVDIAGNKSHDPFEMVRLTREHNDANVLSLAVRFVSEEDAKKAIEVFLGTSFSHAERHKRRIEKMTTIEE